LSEPLQQVDRTYVRWRGRKLSYFSGCDYFRLSTDARIHRALEDGLKRYGLNVAASRITTGDHVLYHRIESRAARFFGAEAALLVSTGYLTNLVVAQALSRQFSHALIDSAAHTSLQDAANLLDCPVVKFAHRSVCDLSAAVKRCGPRAKLIVLTDGLFARDGCVAPLRDYAKILPTDTLMLVDDAHGAGVLGAQGRGTLEHTVTSRARVIQTITLSKAFGAYGGVILCSERLRKLLIRRSSLFVGSTPLPLPLASAGLESFAILARSKSLRARLNAHTDYVRNALIESDISVPRNPGPIISIETHGAANTEKFKRVLLKFHIFPPFLHYPGAPSAGYFRFVISSEHAQQQLQNLIRALISSASLISPLALR
jgi:8-amino-7-oxononanoate synthase